MIQSKNILMNIIFLKLRGLGCTTYVCGCVTHCLGLPKFLNCHTVHWWEVSFDKIYTMLRSVHTEVQFKVHSVFSYPEGICHVGTNQFKSFYTLCACVWSWFFAISNELRSNITNSSSFTDMNGSIIEIVMRNHVQHFNI